MNCKALFCAPLAHPDWSWVMVQDQEDGVNPQPQQLALGRKKVQSGPELGPGTAAEVV